MRWPIRVAGGTRKAAPNPFAVSGTHYCGELQMAMLLAESQTQRFPRHVGDRTSTYWRSNEYRPVVSRPATSTAVAGCGASVRRVGMSPRSKALLSAPSKGDLLERALEMRLVKRVVAGEDHPP